MKVKSPAATSGVTRKSHAYLGHFAKSKFINAGHNTVTGALSSVMETVGRALNTDRGKSLKDADKVVAPPKEDVTARRVSIDKAVERAEKGE